MDPRHRRRDPVTLLSPLTANAQATTDGVDCGLPDSDAEALVILNNSYPGYRFPSQCAALQGGGEGTPRRQAWC